MSIVYVPICIDVNTLKISKKGKMDDRHVRRFQRVFHMKCGKINQNLMSL